MSITIDRKDKRRILEELKDEVNQFHKVLDEVFQKLPRVQNIEYTHGPNEKGADFVIKRLDDTIGDTEYIGTIVKTGTINTSLTNIFDQIQDCDSERLILNGNKKIILSEIWIVTNQTISSRAKEKIYDKFKGRKIKFVDRDLLITWIDKFLPSFWSIINISVARYLQNVLQLVSDLDSSYSLMPSNVEPFYIETQVSEIIYEYSPSRSKKAKQESVYDLALSKKLLLLEGGPGAGKSQLIRNIIKNYTQPETYLKTKAIPFLLSYSDFVKEYEGTLSNVLKNIVKLINDRHELSDARYLIFIDGFDELIKNERDVKDELKKLTTETLKHTDVNVILATRPLGVIDYRKYLPSASPGYEITKFGTSKIVSFIERICKESRISNRLFEDMKKNNLFKQLPKNPISAILLANLINDNSKDLPANLTDIYKKFTELMLGRWDLKKGLQSDQEYEIGKEILTYIAKYFIENSLSSISTKEATEQFEDYLKERNLEIDSKYLFRKIVSRSGILQENCANKTVYFKHRSFAEYFYAIYKTQHTDENFLDNRAFDPLWRNIYFFYVGTLKDCKDVLETILEIENTAGIHDFLRVITMADYFLASYTTPYRIVSDNLPKLILQYTRLYLDIVNNQIDTPLKDMPEITVLEFFQAVINNAYSYEFFVKSLDNAIVEILSDDSVTEVEKSYSLFFISVIYRALDKPNPFDGLLEEFKGKIPLPLQVGLYYESKRDNNPSKLLKKVERNFRQKFKKQRDIKQYVELLHDKPLKKIKN